jgi:hypothetical protein
MGVLQQIPKQLAVNVWNNNSAIYMGRFKTNRNGYMAHIWTRIYINGIINIEQIRINIYSHQDKRAVYAQSNWANLINIEDLSQYWLGFVRLDFNSENIQKDELYFFDIEINNYTRNGNNFYIGVTYDFPFPTHDLTETNWKNSPLSAKIFLREKYEF